MTHQFAGFEVGDHHHLGANELLGPVIEALDTPTFLSRIGARRTNSESLRGSAMRS